MAVSPVSSPVVTLPPPAKPTAAASAKQSSIAAAQQEATESLATTRKEAQSGDKVAIKKLKQELASQQQSNQSAPSDAGKGKQVDSKA